MTRIGHRGQISTKDSSLIVSHNLYLSIRFIRVIRGLKSAVRSLPVLLVAHAESKEPSLDAGGDGDLNLLRGAVIAEDGRCADAGGGPAAGAQRVAGFHDVCHSRVHGGDVAGVGDVERGSLSDDAQSGAACGVWILAGGRFEKVDFSIAVRI